MLGIQPEHPILQDGDEIIEKYAEEIFPGNGFPYVIFPQLYSGEDDELAISAATRTERKLLPRKQSTLHHSVRLGT